MDTSLKRIKTNGNLRDFLYKDIVLGEQDESVYETTSNYEIAFAFRDALSSCWWDYFGCIEKSLRKCAPLLNSRPFFVHQRNSWYQKKQNSYFTFFGRSVYTTIALILQAVSRDGKRYRNRITGSSLFVTACAIITLTNLYLFRLFFCDDMWCFPITVFP